MDQQLNIELTVFCCLLDTRFVLWGVGAETHEVEPAHMQRRAFKEINRHNCSIVNADTGADCGFQGNNGTQCWAKKAVSFITPTHHAGIIDFMLRVTGIGSLKGGNEMNTWQSALEINSNQELNVGGLIESLNKTYDIWYCYTLAYNLYYWFEASFALWQAKTVDLFYRLMLYFTQTYK